MAQVHDSNSSPFYKNRFKQLPALDKGNFGPAMYGPYQQRWDPTNRQWVRPDGSKGVLAGGFSGLHGLGEFGADMQLPSLDLTGATSTALFTKETFISFAGALLLGLGGTWALGHHHKLAGVALLGLGGIAAIVGVVSLKTNADAVSAAQAWNNAGPSSSQQAAMARAAPQQLPNMKINGWWNR